MRLLRLQDHPLHAGHVCSAAGDCSVPAAIKHDRHASQHNPCHHRSCGWHGHGRNLPSMPGLGTTSKRRDDLGHITAPGRPLWRLSSLLPTQSHHGSSWHVSALAHTPISHVSTLHQPAFPWTFDATLLLQQLPYLCSANWLASAVLLAWLDRQCQMTVCITTGAYAATDLQHTAILPCSYCQQAN